MAATCTKMMPITAFVTGIGSKAFFAPKNALKLYQQNFVIHAKHYARGPTFRAAGIRAETKTQSLKERLLGPTTGKPFAVGSAALAGASAVGVGALCFYGLGLSNETGTLEKSIAWPQYVKDRLHSTYGYLAGGLSMTAAAGLAVARNPKMLNIMSKNSLMMMFGSLTAIIGSGAIARGIPYTEGIGAKHFAWAAHCGILGAVLAPMCYMGGPLLMRAAWYTAGVVGGLSAIAVCAPSDKFLKMGGPLAMGLGVVFVSSIGTWFLPPTTALGAGIWSIAMYGGLILFGGFLLYDTQRVIRLAENYPPPGSLTYYNRQGKEDGVFDPINAQMSIYLDTLNIFIRIAMIMGMGGSRRK